MIIIIAILTGAAVTLIAAAALQRIASLSLEKKLKENLGGVVAAGRKGVGGNVLFLADKIGSKLSRRNHPKLTMYAASIGRNLRILGPSFSNYTPYTIIGLSVLTSAVSVLISLLLLGIYNLALLTLIAAAGIFMPAAFLKDRVKAKHKEIFRQIPDLLDLLTLMIEAGLDFNNALLKIITTEKGALINEFSVTQQEVKLGTSRSEAFNHMADRLACPPLTTVLNTFVLALRTGGSMAPTLRALSDQFRSERSQLAEKLAAEAPVKLMAPLILLIFPTIFIILFGPIMLSFMN